MAATRAHLVPKVLHRVTLEKASDHEGDVLAADEDNGRPADAPDPWILEDTKVENQNRKACEQVTGKEELHARIGRF